MDPMSQSLAVGIGPFVVRADGIISMIKLVPFILTPAATRSPTRKPEFQILVRCVQAVALVGFKPFPILITGPIVHKMWSAKVSMLRYQQDSTRARTELVDAKRGCVDTNGGGITTEATTSNHIYTFIWIVCLVFQAFVDPILLWFYPVVGWKEILWTTKHHFFKAGYLLVFGGLHQAFFWVDLRNAEAITRKKENELKEKNDNILSFLTSKRTNIP